MICFLCDDEMTPLNDGVFYCPICQYYEDLNLLDQGIDIFGDVRYTQIMIKYEHDMLVLSPALSKYDQIAINDFVEATLEKQKSQILDKIKKLEDQSHATRTPLYQELLFSKVKNIVEDK